MALECYNCGGRHRKDHCTEPCEQCHTRAKGGHIRDHTGQECRKRHPSNTRGRGGAFGQGGGREYSNPPDSCTAGGLPAHAAQGQLPNLQQPRGYSADRGRQLGSSGSRDRGGGYGGTSRGGSTYNQGNSNNPHSHGGGRGQSGAGRGEVGTLNQGQSHHSSQSRDRGGRQGGTAGGGNTSNPGGSHNTSQSRDRQGGEPRSWRGKNVANSGFGNRNVQGQGYKHSCLDTASKLHYPNFKPKQDLVPTGNIKAWTLLDEIRDCDARNATITEPSHPLRSAFFEDSTKTAGKSKADMSLQVLTNHFECTLSIDDMFEYKLTNMGTTDKRKITRIYRKTIESENFLKDYQDKFVTNDFDLIVAWENLHQRITSAVSEGDGITHGKWDLSVSFGKSTVDIQFELIRKLDTRTIGQYSLGKANAEKETFQSISKCLNLVISKTFDESKLYRHAANKFYVKDARQQLFFSKNDGNRTGTPSKSLELVRGYFYTVKPGMGNMILNFNLATSAFFRPIPVCDFLNDSDSFPRHRENILKNMRVYIMTERARIEGEDWAMLNSEKCRIKKVYEVGPRNIGDLTFQKRIKDKDGKFEKNSDGNFRTDGKDMKVVDYLKATFGVDAQLGRKAINCGKDKNPIWYAQEQLLIMPWQILRQPVPEKLNGSMVEQAAKEPDQGRALIEGEGLDVLQSLTQTVPTMSVAPASSGGVPLQLETGMLQIPCTRLDFPRPLYKQPKTAAKGKGNLRTSFNISDYHDASPVRPGSRWSMPQEFVFYAPKSVDKPFCYRILRDSVITPPPVVKQEPKPSHKHKEKEQRPPPPPPPTFEETIASHLENFKAQLIKCGLSEAQISPEPELEKLPDFTETSIASALRDAKNSNVDLVILMLRSNDKDTYARFKKLADQVVGIHTACMVHKTFSTPKLHNEYITNIMMKVNLKMGGICHSVNDVYRTLSTSDIMVLGADVIHPGPNAYSGCPSIAAMVGSVDYHVGKCLGSMRLQRCVGRDGAGKLTPITDREIIQEVEAMVTERLEAWLEMSETGKLPQNILYYRLVS